MPTSEGAALTSVSILFHPITLCYLLHSIDYYLNVSCLLSLGCEHCSRSRTSSGLFSGLLLDWEPGLVMCSAQNVRTVLSVIIHWLLSPHLSPLFLMFILQSPSQDPETTETHISWLEVSPWPWHMTPQLLSYWSHKLFDVRVHFLYITTTHLTELICVCMP